MLEGMKPTKKKSYVCKVSTIIEELDSTDAEILSAAIGDDKTWPAAMLATELRKRKLSISDMTILRHRKQTCVCYREIG